MPSDLKIWLRDLRMGWGGWGAKATQPKLKRRRTNMVPCSSIRKISREHVDSGSTADVEPIAA
jgi:hypothetical protein